MMALPADMLTRQAHAALQRGDVVSARSLCEEAVAKSPKDVGALSLLAFTLQVTGHTQQAVTYWNKCIRLQPKNPDMRTSLGQLHASLAQYRQALHQLDAALKLAPDHVDALIAKAMIFERQRMYSRARKLLSPLVSRDAPPPGLVAVYLRVLIHDGEIEEAIALGESVRLRGLVPDTWSRDVLFALARAYEKKGDYARTMEVAADANAMLAVPWDPAEAERFVDHMIEVFSADRMKTLPRATVASELPIFIVGMPRTGSTLVERIIHCHPDAHGAGEIPTLQLLAEGVPGRAGLTTPFPTCVPELTEADVTSVAESYLEEVTGSARRAKRVVDKYLGNYRYLGFINLLFPQGRVIDCRRNAMDNCLSCYLERLTPESTPYATSLEHLGRQYRQYERLMSHWHEVLDMPLLEVGYEELIGDQEAITRRILEFCGLPWNDACMKFYETERYDNTLSFDQVRRPLYNQSVGRAERFGALLDPLRKALG